MSDVDDHFIGSRTGFPPDNFSDLAWPVVSPDGQLSADRLESANQFIRATDGFSSEEMDRAKEIVRSLARNNFDPDDINFIEEDKSVKERAKEYAYQMIQGVVTSSAGHGHVAKRPSEMGEDGQQQAQELWTRRWHDLLPLSDGSDDYVYHRHYMGIKASDLDIPEDRARRADELAEKRNSAGLSTQEEEEFEELSQLVRNNMPEDPDALLESDVAVHEDFRFGFSDGLHGWTVLRSDSEISAGSTIQNQENANTFRAQPKTVQTRDILNVGLDSPLTIGPDNEGAFPQSWGAIYALNKGEYTIGTFHKHFSEYMIDSDEIGDLSGRYTFISVPLGGQRAWNLDRQQNNEPFAERNTLARVIEDRKESGDDFLMWNNPSEPSDEPQLIELANVDDAEAEAERIQSATHEDEMSEDKQKIAQRLFDHDSSDVDDLADVQFILRGHDGSDGGGEKTESESIQKIDRIVKADDERQILYAIALEPNEVDTDGDFVSEEEIFQASSEYLSESRVIGLQHQEQADAELHGSLIIPEEWANKIDGIKANTWVVAIKVHDSMIWEGLKEGEFKGVSIGGFAV